MLIFVGNFVFLSARVIEKGGVGDAIQPTDKGFLTAETSDRSKPFEKGILNEIVSARMMSRRKY